jgi:hypothetical protein
MNGIHIYIVIFIILFIFLNYSYYKEKRREYIAEKRSEMLLLDDFFYHPKLLKESKRRKIWIYIPLELNSRHWESFGSRTSTHINLSVMNLCIKSIIDWCSQSYDIILFTDKDIPDILQSNESVDLSTLSGDVLEKHRQLSILEILYEYGGILLPPTIYMRNNIKYQDPLDTWFVVDMFNTHHSSVSSRVPSMVITGAPAKNAQLRNYIDYLSLDEKQEYTDNYFIKNRISVLDGTIFGTKDKLNKHIILDDLMSNKKLNLSEHNVGLYLPYCELMKRNHYKWYTRMSERQVLSCNCAFSYYILENS